VDMLLEDYPPMLKQIQKAISEGDSVVLRRTAHALKGMVGNFQAKTAAKAAFKLEEMGRSGELADAKESLKSLATEMNRFEKSIVGMLSEAKT